MVRMVGQVGHVDSRCAEAPDMPWRNVLDHGGEWRARRDRSGYVRTTPAASSRMPDSPALRSTFVISAAARAAHRILPGKPLHGAFGRGALAISGPSGRRRTQKIPRRRAGAAAGMMEEAREGYMSGHVPMASSFCHLRSAEDDRHRHSSVAGTEQSVQNATQDQACAAKPRTRSPRWAARHQQCRYREDLAMAAAAATVI